MIGACTGGDLGRPPVFSAEVKTRIVLSVLSGETSIAQADREEQVSEASVSRWKASVGHPGGCLRGDGFSYRR